MPYIPVNVLPVIDISVTAGRVSTHLVSCHTFTAHLNVEIYDSAITATEVCNITTLLTYQCCGNTKEWVQNLCLCNEWIQ